MQIAHIPHIIGKVGLEKKILEIIEKLLYLKRKHATFQEYPIKRIKECGIVDDFLNPENHLGIHNFVEFGIPESDPPDALLYDKNGEEVSLEVTELVNEIAIKAQIHNLPTYWEESTKWIDLGYFEERLNNRIQIKDEKCSNLFDQNKTVQLLLHTDELWIESCYKRHFESGVKLTQHRFSKIWLLLSYSTQTKSCPIIEIS